MKKTILLLTSLFLLAACKVDLPEVTDFAVAPETLSINAEGGQLAIAVYSDGDIDAAIASDCDWARIVSDRHFSGDGEILIDVNANSSTKRKTDVTIIYKGGKLDKVIPLSQDGQKAFLELVNDDLRIDAAAASENEIGLRTNIDASALVLAAEYSGDHKDWIGNLTAAGDKISFSTPVGFDTPQPAVITVSYEDAVVGKLSVKANVLLSDKDGYFEAGPHTEIRNAAELVKFLLNAPEMDAEAAYSITADIDMKDVTFVPADNFKGTLAGGNHKIMNLEASQPLFRELAGSVSDLVIDSSCTLNLDQDSDAAFIVGRNSGTVRGCVNNGKVLSSKQVFNASRSVAGIVAVNTGTVASCTNNGDLEILSEAFYQAPLWLGGVVGKTSGDADVASVKDCANNGKVTLTVDRCKSAVFVGGVVGGTPADAVTVQYSVETLKDYGNISGCTNTGAVAVTYIENTTPMLNANIGGVVAYVQGSVVSCGNEGALSFSSSTSGEYSLKHTSLGGVAGFVLKSIARCSNSGPVSVVGQLGGGTVGEVGSSYYPGTLMGGVVGMAGANDGSGSVEDCRNEAALDFQPSVYSASKAIFYIGGVCGFAKAPVSGCSNTRDVTVRSNAKNKFLGGICGLSSFAVADCVNRGKVTVDNIVTSTSDDAYSLSTYIGGITAYHAVAAVDMRISRCSNSGEINYLNGPKGATDINYVGGIAGLSLGEINGGSKDSRSVNSGNINYLGSTRCYLGGISGNTTAKVLWMDNSGSVTATGANNEGIANSSMVGGFIGVAMHQLSVALDGGAKANYGVGAKKAGYTGSTTGNVTAKLQDGSTGTGVGLVFGKVNAAGSGANAYCNYHSATISGALNVTGGTTVKAAIIAGAGFGNYSSAPVGIIAGIESGHDVLKAPISVNGVVITAENFKDYLAYGQNENVVTTYIDYEN